MQKVYLLIPAHHSATKPKQLFSSMEKAQEFLLSEQPYPYTIEILEVQ